MILPCLYKGLCTVLTEELASGTALTPPCSKGTQAEYSADVEAGSLEGAEEAVELFDFEGIVSFKLLEGDLVGIGDAAGIDDELGVWVL